MATKLQCKSFLPDRCTPGEVPIAVHGTTTAWPLYSEDRPLSMQFCNGFASVLIGSPGYQKEFLKQTMLKHEATFRAQLYQLHRLYRIQRELTEELTTKDLSHHSPNLQPSHSSTITSNSNQLNSLCFPVPTSRPPSATTKSFATEPHPSPAPTDTAFWYGPQALGSQPYDEVVPIHLRLPADAYPHLRNAKGGGDTQSFTHNLFHPPALSCINPDIITSPKDTILSLASRQPDDGLQRHTLSSVSRHSQISDSFSDLNKPINSSPNLPRCQQAPHRDSDLFNKAKETSHVTPFQKGFPSLDGVVKTQEFCFSNHGSGNSSGIVHAYGETGHKFAEPLKTHESFLLPLSTRSHSQAFFKDKSRLNGTGKSIPANSICTVLTMPQFTCAMPSNFTPVNTTFPSVNSLTDLEDRGDDNVSVPDSRSVSIWGSTSTNRSKIEHVSNCIIRPDACDRQKLGFSSSHSTGYVASEMKSSPGVYLPPLSSSGQEKEAANLAHSSTTTTNRDQIPFPGLGSSECKPAVMGIDLNFALPSDLLETFGQQDVANNKYSDAEGPVSGLSWLKSESPHSLVLAEGSSGSLNRVQPKNKETSRVDGSFNGATDFSHPTESSSKVDLSDLQKQSSEELVSDKSSATAGGRMAINLTSLDSFTGFCTPNSPKDFISQGKLALTSHDDLAVPGKGRPVIDLELPAELFGEEPPSVSYMVDAPASVTVATDADSKTQEDSKAKRAAETIVEMSCKICECPLPESINRHLSDQISADHLHWFADVVSSHTGASSDSRVPSNDGLDFLEAMTLQLVETKVDQFLPTVPDKENREEDSCSISPCLLTKARRGQARKRRQRRDFQKDVLPGLASLSRHEVSEDIQIIGGMMRAVGQIWQSGVARRNNGRNAGGGQAKGRRRQRGGAAAAVIGEEPVESPPRNANFADFEIDARSIMGWGRTRRCRRSRCPPGISGLS